MKTTPRFSSGFIAALGTLAVLLSTSAVIAQTDPDGILPKINAWKSGSSSDISADKSTFKVGELIRLKADVATPYTWDVPEALKANSHEDVAGKLLVLSAKSPGPYTVNLWTVKSHPVPVIFFPPVVGFSPPLVGMHSLAAKPEIAKSYSIVIEGEVKKDPDKPDDKNPVIGIAEAKQKDLEDEANKPHIKTLSEGVRSLARKVETGTEFRKLGDVETAFKNVLNQLPTGRLAKTRLAVVEKMKKDMFGSRHGSTALQSGIRSELKRLFEEIANALD